MYKTMWKAICDSGNVHDYGLFEVVTTWNPYSLAKHSYALLQGDLIYPMFFQTPFQYSPIPARVLILYFTKTLIILVVMLFPLEILRADIKSGEGKDLWLPSSTRPSLTIQNPHLVTHWVLSVSLIECTWNHSPETYLIYIIPLLHPSEILTVVFIIDTNIL